MIKAHVRQNQFDQKKIGENDPSESDSFHTCASSQSQAKRISSGQKEMFCEIQQQLTDLPLHENQRADTNIRQGTLVRHSSSLNLIDALKRQTTMKINDERE